MTKPTVILLAGGTGTRFAPFVSDKLLWPIAGKPFVEHVLNILAACELNSIIAITNNTNREFFESQKNNHKEMSIIPQGEDKGMSGALKSASQVISKQPILVLNADDIFEINLIKSLLSKIQTDNPKTLLVGLSRSELLPVGYLKISNSKVSAVVEKPSEKDKPSDYIKLTMDYFRNSDDLFERLASTPISNPDSHYEDLLSRILTDEPADFVEYSGYWNKLKYPHYVLEIMSIFQNHIIKKHISDKAHVSDRASIVGEVYIDEGARIEDSAIVKGPSYIGRNVVIGNNTLVRSSFVEEGAVVGFGSEVARSYVGPKCQVHHSFIGDSVLESDINMSWGTVTANLRLDGKEVSLKHPNGSNIKTGRTKLGAMIAKGAFLGINTSTMPGVCISANTKLLPGTMVKKTI